MNTIVNFASILALAILPSRGSLASQPAPAFTLATLQADRDAAWLRDMVFPKAQLTRAGASGLTGGPTKPFAGAGVLAPDAVPPVIVKNPFLSTAP
ncbi:MAG: hypothetical protein HY765_05730 [Rhodomicrobium sp.]|nr:hypothetical protein [Rhodomicrobium sp.]